MEDRLKYIFENVNYWLSFAETKNAALVGFNSTVIIGLLAIINTENIALNLAVNYVLTPTFTIAIFLSLIALMPVLKYFKSDNKKAKYNDNSNIYYFGTLKDLSPKELLRILDSTETNEVISDMTFNRFERDLANQIIMNSGITWAKYRFFNIASYFTIIGFLLSILLYIFAVIYL